MAREMRGAKSRIRPKNTVAAAADQASHSPSVVGHGNATSMICPPLASVKHRVEEWNCHSERIPCRQEAGGPKDRDPNPHNGPAPRGACQPRWSASAHFCMGG